MSRRNISKFNLIRNFQFLWRPSPMNERETSIFTSHPGRRSVCGTVMARNVSKSSTCRAKERNVKNQAQKNCRNFSFNYFVHNELEQLRVGREKRVNLIRVKYDSIKRRKLCPDERLCGMIRGSRKLGKAVSYVLEWKDLRNDRLQTWGFKLCTILNLSF